MKRGYVVTALAIGCLSILASCATVAEVDEQPAAKKSSWFTSFDAASAEAQKSGKPILANFTAGNSDPWGAPWCWKLDREVFEQKDFKEWAANNVVLLELVFPFRRPQDEATKKANAELAGKYKVEEYPTIIFMTADGKPLGLMGYERGGAQVWIEIAQKILDGKN